MTDQDWRQVKVTFRKAVSDGNYGTESAEVTLEDWVFNATGSGTLYSACAEELLKHARELVHAELLRSPSSRVRETIERIKTYSGRAGEDDDGEGEG